MLKQKHYFYIHQVSDHGFQNLLVFLLQMADRILLEGKFNSNMRRLGAIGLIAAGIGGVVTYAVVKNRENKMKAYFE